MSRSASRHSTKASSRSVTLSAVSGMAKPMRSRYRDSRRSVASSGWKLTATEKASGDAEASFSQTSEDASLSTPLLRCRSAVWSAPSTQAPCRRFS